MKSSTLTTVMVSLLPATLLVMVLSTLATSQPFTQAETSKQSDFKWNTRKIGNKKVATLRIRKDEERDRRSIPLAEADDDMIGTGRRRHHPHRHHHGEDTRTSVWQADGRGTERDEGEEEVMKPGMGLAPLHLTESNLDDRHLRRSRLNDVRPGLSRSEETLVEFQEILDAAGYHMTPSLFKNTTRKASPRRNNQRRDNRVKRTRKTSKEKNKKAKRRRRKSSKNCRRLKGRRKRRCRQALRACRRLKGRERKRCRAEVFESFPQSDIFSFIEGKIEMLGEEACQYHYLKECCKKVGMLNQPSHTSATLIKCRFREEFLKCMEEQRLKSCDSSFSTRGNMTALRNKIREVVWTPSSCLVSEVIEG
ncbi:hypothetical protein Pmani_002435 [Petrolisthes manimaculis]|uniref:Uncharacterized protein n=1 Tax=Petrolisthes manimaculis TaxID=1843537 RepID=A0AAE1QHW9_9EUCA|nr:hypothetical protein Pmani_002435 [Petrolisthes manimaculis]